MKSLWIAGLPLAVCCGLAACGEQGGEAPEGGRPSAGAQRGALPGRPRARAPEDSTRATLGRPRGTSSVGPGGASPIDPIVDAFHTLYYDSGPSTWQNTTYRGVPILKIPLDMWLYQEIIWDLKPDLIIETGTASGGSAVLMADLLDIIGRGEVITVDIEDRAPHSGTYRPSHPRVRYLTGSSTSEKIVAQVRAAVPPGATVMVVLDSDHSRDHVLAEMNIYAELVSAGSYLIVEDSNINGHPVLPGCYPGPMEALESFLQHRDDFAIDTDKHKFLVSFNPNGYLRRTGAAGR